ncbi:LacI family DNA-binding transcriptional regulator [Acerihabitans arboris]|uniref:LacI family DNA-binding transcriptional regulator n=1 Tax=Acerihabitans arboris TaxID=2691583 RepID=A0A845SEQ5_9GAMM|nr:LacI family DNA-binding transcriptional regulator [Acerihabitans arboris]NDL63270.1 LacI family DNA-binding transcriptional regulator [Acerihabitans arboris]
MKGKLNITEIARETGLSISTVSRVLAGKTNTSAGTRARVLQAARRDGVMNNLSSGRLLLNGLLVFAPPRAFDVRTDIFYYKVIQGITRALERHEVRLRYCALEENDSDAALFLAKMSQPETEAALIVGIDDARIHTLAAELRKPCVLINCYDRRMRLPSVSPHHQLIGEFSTHYLIEQGHRNILTLQCLRRYTMELRMNGIREAWNTHNLAFDEERHQLVAQGFGTAESEQRLGEFIRRCPPSERPSAILAGGDFMAVGAVNALREAGLRVPQDVSVMSMDGFNLAAIHDIPLTSVHVPRDELGMEAVRMLQQRLLCPDGPVGNLLLNGRLMIRDSVRRIRANKNHSAVQRDGLYD